MIFLLSKTTGNDPVLGERFPIVNEQFPGWTKIYRIVELSDFTDLLPLIDSGKHGGIVINTIEPKFAESEQIPRDIILEIEIYDDWRE